MKMTMSDIDAKLESVIELWKSSGTSKQDRRVLFSSGIGANCIWSYGITSRYTFCFFLESPIQFGCGKQLCTKNIQSSEIKEGNTWYLQFELLEIMDLDIFAKLIKDLIAESMKHHEDESCIHAVVERFEQWREMMSHVASHQAEEKCPHRTIRLLQANSKEFWRWAKTHCLTIRDLFAHQGQ